MCWRRWSGVSAVALEWCDIPARTTMARELGVHGFLSHDGELVERELGHRLTLELVEKFDDRARTLLVHQLLRFALLFGLG